MLDFAGLEKPVKLPGMSLRPLATGQLVKSWRDDVVVGNNMVQGGPVGLLRPVTEGRMLRHLRDTSIACSCLGTSVSRWSILKRIRAK